MTKSQGQGWELRATAERLEPYFAPFLANGRIHATGSRRGTEPALTYLAGVMDHTAGDVSRPAALPAWMEIDVNLGGGWLNAGAFDHERFGGFAQVLDMRAGELRTSYRCDNGAAAAEVTVETLVSAADARIAATRLTLLPAASAQVELRLPLVGWPAPAQRLPLTKLDWAHLKAELAAGAATEPVTPEGVAPDRILTWLDLQQALLAEGRRLRLPDAAAPTRAAVWYPGETQVVASGADGATLVQWIDGRAAAGSDFGLAVTNAIEGLDALETALERSEQGTVLRIRGRAQAGRPVVVGRYAAMAVGAAAETLSPVAIAARLRGYGALAAEQRAAWDRLWACDIELEGDDDLQRVIRSDLFYLLATSSADSGLAPGACGMAPGYFGHVFFDADNWVFPVLLPFDPVRARQIADYRLRTLPQARDKARHAGYRGAMYPWEADPETGLEETPRYAGVNALREILHNGGIAVAHWQYYLVTQDRAWLAERGYPVIAATAEFWLSRVTHDPVRRCYDILGVVSVDEKYEDADNDAYTNAIARKNLRIAAEAARVLGKAPDPRWEEVADHLTIPFSETERRHLMFSRPPHDRKTWMAGALTFLCYPAIDLEMPDDVRRNDYDYAVRKIAELAPEPNQMMMVMLAVHAAELGDGDAALRWLTFRQEGFLKPPFNLRSETPHNNATHHLATSTGFLQALIYGFTGLRIGERGLVEQYRPVLPAGWRRLTLRNVLADGVRQDITVCRDACGKVVLERRRVAIEAPPA